MSLPLLKSTLTALARDRRGVAGIEFAFVAIILAGLIAGLATAGLQILQDQRLNNIAARVADLITQESSLTEAKVDSILDSAKYLAGNDGLGAQGTIIISGIAGQSDGSAKVVWQRKGAGTLSETSRIGAVSKVATLPTGFTVPASQTVVSVEVMYRPGSGSGTTTGSSTNTTVRTSLLRSRKSELATLAPSS